MKQRLTLFFIIIHISIALAQQQDYTELSAIFQNPTQQRLERAKFILDSLENSTNSAYEKQVIYAKRAVTFLLSNDFDKAQQSIDQGMQLCQGEHCFPAKAKLYYQQAKLYYAQQKLPQATETILNCNMMLEKYAPNSKELPPSYTLASFFYNLLGKENKSEETLLKSVKLSKKLGLTKNLGDAYNNLGILAKKQKKWKKALGYFQASLREDKAEGNTSHLSKTYNNIASMFLASAQTDSAKYYLKLAEGTPIKRKNESSSANINLINVYEKEKKTDSIDAYIEKSLSELDSGTYDLTQQKELFKTLSRVFADKKEYKKAYEFLQKEHSLQTIWWETEGREEIVSDVEKTAKLKQQKEVIKMLEQKNYYQDLALRQRNFLIISLALLAVSGVLILFFWLKQNQLKQQAEHLRLEHQVLRSQMNPHFIFNTLTAIQNMLMKKDTLQSASAIAKFSKLIRQNFDFIQKDHIQLQDDLQALKNYIDTQKMRFGDSFSYTINIDEEIDPEKLEIPPMLLQPFVENTIEHGFKQLDKKGEFTLNISLIEDDLWFELLDNGVGYIPKKGKKKHAMDIIKARLKLFNKGDDNSFIIMNRKEGGTKVKFKLKPKWL